MRILLTGAYGFVGQHLAKKLFHLGHTIVDAGRNGTNSNGCDLIIHLAGKTTLSKEFDPKLIEDNIIYSEKLFSKARCKIIYASSTSASEYTNPYAGTKMYLEHLGKLYGNAVGLRFFNIYGPNNNKGIIKRAIECANSGETLIVHGGDQIRDFIYIDDVVKWICNNLDHEPGIVDIGRGEGMTIDKAIATVAEVINKPIYVRHFDPSDADMKVSVASPGIGGISLAEGLKKMLNKTI